MTTSMREVSNANVEQLLAIIDRLSRHAPSKDELYALFESNAIADVDDETGIATVNMDALIDDIARLYTSPRKVLAALKPFAWPPLYVFDTPNNQMWVPTRMPDGWVGGGGVSTGEYRNAREAIMRETR